MNDPWGEAFDEVGETVADAVGCLAPFIIMIAFVLGMKLLFWVLSL